MPASSSRRRIIGGAGDPTLALGDPWLCVRRVITMDTYILALDRVAKAMHYRGFYA